MNEKEAVDVEEQAAEEQAPEEQGNEENNGHLTMDDYVAQGGNADMYRGKAAFNQHYDQQQEIKKLRRSSKDVMSSVTQVLEQQKQLVNAQNAEQREANEAKILDLQDQLSEAHGELDSKKAVAVQKKIDKLEAKIVEPTAQEQVANPQGHFDELLDFKEDNPEFDQNSKDFNPSLNDVVTQEFDRQYNPSMSDREVRRLLKKTSKAVKARPEFAPKQAKTPPQSRTPGKKPPATNAKAKLKNLDDSGRNMYNFIKDSNGDAAATEFLNSMEA